MKLYSFRSKTGVVLDNVSFAAMSDGESYGRSIDGSNQLVYFAQRNSNNGKAQR